MLIRERMRAILSDAELRLVKLANEAGDARAYAEGAALMKAARQIQQIAEQLLGNSAGEDEATTAPSTEPAARVSTKNLRTNNHLNTIKKTRRLKYPRFFRASDSLVKVGWSKSESSEYEHKCPRRVLDVLVSECARIAGPSKRFVMEKLLPLRDPDSGAELPGYQAYVALAFLRQAGLVEQHGRSGYSIPKSKSVVADADVAWNGIESR